MRGSASADNIAVVKHWKIEGSNDPGLNDWMKELFWVIKHNLTWNWNTLHPPKEEKLGRKWWSRTETDHVQDTFVSVNDAWHTKGNGIDGNWLPLSIYQNQLEWMSLVKSTIFHDGPLVSATMTNMTSLWCHSFLSTFTFKNQFENHTHGHAHQLSSALKTFS